MSFRLGYACISSPLREKGIFTSRTLTLKSMKEKGIEAAKELALKNIDDLITIIQYNEDNGLRFFRLTSNLFPHAENKLALQQYTIDFAREKLARAGRLARSYGHRITMHPGQFAQLGSPREEVVEQTFRDLNLHADIIHAMGYKPELGSCLIIHGGGSFGDKEKTLARWEENYNKLPKQTRDLIVLENDDYQYTVMDLLPMCERNNIPICIDFFHHECLGRDQFNIFDKKLIKRVMNIWRKRSMKPKFHWSNQMPGQRKGAHGDCVKDIPKQILNICREYDCDIMLETKLKDICTLKMYKKYFNRVNNNGRIEFYLK
ncbi:UV-damage endonuclease Uvde [Pacmanvirus A23]|uniref:endonuclease n=1 Tax=Pacmanvirus A23 TaxID=1932881 RepID=UPI000A094D99|nr:endonuclease [Pacmanvirus A23]SIP85860.1 UV-damage endonuclease Uvde [Pacmanvirus A23]